MGSSVFVLVDLGFSFFAVFIIAFFGSHASFSLGPIDFVEFDTAGGGGGGAGNIRVSGKTAFVLLALLARTLFTEILRFRFCALTANVNVLP